jgi:hypothetical protein
VHTPTAEAPAMSISTTSVPRVTPPTPMTGRSTARAMSRTQRTASGFSAGPLIQP